MKAIITGDRTRSVLKLILIGACAGFINGLLGSGGGILVVFGMTPLIADADGKRDVFANALAVMIPISLVSAITYASAGRIDIGEFGIYVLPAAIGGVIGAVLLDKLKVGFLRRLFAILVIWSGVYLITRI